jgi:transposase-like protein
MDHAQEVPAGAGGGDPEVPEKAKRRRFEAAYKLRILEEADRLTGPGELGELLRREGLYSSHLTSWRRQRDEGSLAGLAPRRRGRKAKRRDPLAKELDKLRRENQRLVERLRQAETIIDVQKKVSEMLGIPLVSPDEGESE